MRKNYLLGMLSAVVSALFFYSFWSSLIITLLPKKEYFFLAWLPLYRFLGSSFFLKAPMSLTILIGLVFYWYIDKKSSINTLLSIFIIFISAPIFSVGSNLIWILFLALVMFFGYRVEIVIRIIFLVLIALGIYWLVKKGFQQMKLTEQSEERINVIKRNIEKTERETSISKDFSLQKTINRSEVKEVKVERKPILEKTARQRSAKKIKRAECPSLRHFVTKGLTREDADFTLDEIKDFLAKELTPKLKYEIKTIWIRYLTCNTVKRRKATKLSAQLEIKTIDGQEFSPLLRIHRFISGWRVHKILYGDELLVKNKD